MELASIIVICGILLCIGYFVAFAFAVLLLIVARAGTRREALTVAGLFVGIVTLLVAFAALLGFGFFRLH